MKNEKLRKKINSYAIENDIEILFIDFFDNSIIGISGNRLVYDREKMVEEMANDLLSSKEAEDMNDALTQAEEWISCNTERSLGYYGEDAPIIIQKIDYIKEAF